MTEKKALTFDSLYNDMLSCNTWFAIQKSRGWPKENEPAIVKTFENAMSYEKDILSTAILTEVQTDSTKCESLLREVRNFRELFEDARESLPTLRAEAGSQRSHDTSQQSIEENR